MILGYEFHKLLCNFQGSASQQDIKINSCITANVTDLKRKIIGLEQQLDEVSKHCRDIACLDNYSRRTSESLFQSELKHDVSKELTEASSNRKSNGIETQLIYKSSECNNKKSDNSSFTSKPHYDKSVNENPIMVNEYDGHTTKAKNKKSKLHRNVEPGFHKHKTRSVSDNIATSHSTSSFHSLANNLVSPSKANYHSYSLNRNPLKEPMQDLMPRHYKDIKYKNITKKVGDDFKEPQEGNPVKIRKNKQLRGDLDQDFIADIIRRQYKPVKLFGPKESDLSQFSAPICRDQELSMQEHVLDDSELCSCLYGGLPHKRSKHRRDDLNTMRSVCDTRLYSSKKQMRHRNRRIHIDAYSNSDAYDLVPVKERASPKTRRKMVEDPITPYDHYREVPPSPRTLRPRLNLKAQYNTEINEDHRINNKSQLKPQSNRQKSYHHKCVTNFESEVSEVPSENVVKSRKHHKHIKLLKDQQTQNQSQQNINTTNSLKYPQYVNEQTSITIDTSLNKTQETEISIDKTDKALCEIKDILQSFLHEIKKENIASQCDKSDITCKSQDDSNVLQDSTNTKLNSNVIPNSASFNQFNNNNLGQCGLAAPYVAPFNNPCCYPIVPLCPLNCPVTVPGGYLVPNQSFSCMNCGNVPKQSNTSKNVDANIRTETEELIKEIYKFVAQGPIRKHESDNCNNRRPESTTEDAKILTSRSVGGSYGDIQHDANVGTQPLKCYSRSCEAIGSRLIAEPYYKQTNPSYSDTLLEKLSLEVTQSTSETELDTTNSYIPYKNKRCNKFSRVLQSFGFLKKKKKDVIEELSESESVIDVDVHPKHTPPFRQEITNYMMHSQDYYYPPPVESLYPKPHEYQPGPQEYHLGSHIYQSNPHDHQPKSHIYQQRPHEYQSRPHDYEYQSDYHPPYNPNVGGCPSPQLADPYTQRISRMREETSPVMQPPIQRPTAPPFNSSYDSSFSGIQQPLCLKEIEVKSTATQSEKRMSLFHKIKKRMHQPAKTVSPAADNQHQRSFSTQTAQTSSKSTKNTTRPLINWKKIQSKAMQGLQQNDPIAYSLKTQKELAEGDIKLRKAMLKKLFHKKNPFSPRNLIMKTLLGKDKSSFGNPPTVFRPRMFF